MIRGKAIGVVVVLLSALGCTAGNQVQAQDAASPEGASEFVETLGERVLAIEASAQRGIAPEARLSALRDLIQSGFDLDVTAQLVLGKFWRHATREQRTRFRDLFARYLLNTYVRQLSSYRVETLVVIACNRIGQGDFLVQTRIHRRSDIADASWRVRAGAGGYKIIDVVMDGISLALTHRGEFASVISRQGFEGLLEGLHDRVLVQADPLEAATRAVLPASILVSPGVGRLELLARRY